MDGNRTDDASNTKFTRNARDMDLDLLRAYIESVDEAEGRGVP